MPISYMPNQNFKKMLMPEEFACVMNTQKRQEQKQYKI